MDTATVEYLGELRIRATHVRSGDQFLTDAPLDNQGKGEAFSPTDLLATALANCMLTLMGIAANARGLELKHLRARVVKHMASGPRRVERVEVHVTMDGTDLGEAERTLLEAAARTCPVAKSLHPDLVQDIHFIYG
ncbi:MAG: OsmC family protein [Flavobacteriales bacterium]|jgi:putative redox protein|nr:OsmC family protein [Flavobacteriales bacterium]MBK6550485.1 OsmC family protein [Flavobacteriales bacterium]MBK6882966.1 OsmC family protein [Flavobacteriales bacterium]MBK7101951.1 OsmC family protein [Flavobacteriales bacterium]MBK7114305.1 OsmC family protein [Flavobacteriales bacterium]